MFGTSVGQGQSHGARVTSRKKGVQCKVSEPAVFINKPLTQHPSLFAEDVDFRIDFDYDKERRTANEKEYMLPKKFTFTMDPHGMTIHLENLFNGNKFLGK